MLDSFTWFDLNLTPLYMSLVEERYIYTWQNQPLVWLRFIDDYFCVLTHGRESLDEFITHLNTCHHSIKFTTEISQDTVSFLDTSVYIDHTNHTLGTDLFYKPTDSHNYLLYTLAHPKRCKHGISFSQFLRNCRICSRMEDFDKHALDIASHFRRRKYPPEIVEETLIKARRMDRDSLLYPIPKPNSENNNLYLITTYQPGFNALKNTLPVQKNWPF